MKLLFILILLSLLSPVFSRDLTPVNWQEDVPATDESIQHCFVIRTVPGVKYQMESSSDLVSWNVENEIYGLGQEFVTPMYEFTAPPPPDPNAPPVTPGIPTQQASIRMDPATGSTGGTVVSWVSLDNGAARIYKIDGSMDAGWASIPLFWQTYGSFSFSIWHPMTPVTPPAENPLLGVKDTAMIACLEENLAAMNLEVAASIARSRNAPPPAPFDPNSRKFWRVHCDWSLDTDADGSPDWAEFEIAAGGPEILVNGVVGNAFNSDTNGDGIPDGLQIDSDKDGTPDATDIAPSDNTASFHISPAPRYALFPITNAQAPMGWLEPIQISDQGTVLYSNGTWTGGTWTLLATLDNGTGTAFAINDSNRIVGSGSAEIPIGDEGDTRLMGVGCWWESPFDAPERLSVGEGAQTLYPSADSLDWLRYIQCSPYLSNTGEFLMISFQADDDGLQSQGASLWQLPIHNQPATEAPIDSDLYFGNGGLRWGNSNGEPQLFDETGTDLHPPFTPGNVVKLSGNRILAMSQDPPQAAQTHIDGTWKESPTYANAIDMAADGTAIELHAGTDPARVLVNGKWTDISLAAPGIPNPWKDSSVKFWDTTPGGWILAARGGYRLLDIPDDEFSVMLPIRVVGVDPERVVPPPPTDPTAPPDNPPIFLAGGVDHTSMTAMAGEGRVPEIWVMAPNGGASNNVRFQSPLNDTSKLTLDGNTDVVFSPQIVDKKDTQLQVSGKQDNEPTKDIAPKLKLGGTLESLSTPFKIKAMKKRTVKVAVHKVFGIDAQGNQTQPANFPTKADLEDYLNKVYGRQTNTFFEATMYDEKGPAGIGIQFDIASNSPNTLPDLRIIADIADPELILATPNPKSEGDPATANIDVWVIGGGVHLIGAHGPGYGFHLGAEFEGKVIIGGDLLGKTGTPSELSAILLHVFAHEIGHVLMGWGHPDEGDGRAEVMWKMSFSDRRWQRDARDTTRLMCSSDGSDPKKPGKQLIKKEWDLIEAWLVNEEIKNRL